MAKTTIFLDEELRDRINSFIRSSTGKRNFKSAEAVINFLFQQYDEKLKDKMSSIKNKDNQFIFKIPKEAVEDSGLNPGDALKITVEDNKIIIERFK